MNIFDQQTGNQITGWNNKLKRAIPATHVHASISCFLLQKFRGKALIWGDNKLILSFLKNGPLREEIEAQGGIKLIYIDPPFDVGG